MPRMQGAAVQCCMCIVGVFMFLGGMIMLATGISLILNYGVFDITILPPDLNNEEGKKTVGIILTSCGFLAIIVSVIVSVLYLCNKTKSTSINPDELSRIPNTARNNTPDSRHGQDASRRDRGDRPDRRVANSNGAKPVSNGAQRTQPPKNIPGSAEVKLPRAHRKGRHRGKYPRHSRRLEEIKEDAISRKTVDGALAEADYRNDTPRSGSLSSQVTLEDSMNAKIPKVVFEDYNDRPGSVDSAATSQTSDGSYRFSLENDKSRREFQFMNETTRKKDSSNRQFEVTSRDSVSLERYDETSLVGNRNEEECSITSELTTPIHDYNTNSALLPETVSDFSAGGVINYGAAQSDLPELPVSDSNMGVSSYKTAHYTEVHGKQTTGRISPQIDAPEMYTRVEPQNQSGSSLGSLTNSIGS